LCSGHVWADSARDLQLKAVSPWAAVENCCCVQDRDPATLLPVLAQSLREQAVLPQHALFVPPDSSYTSLSRASTGAVDTSWQQQQCDAWNAQLGGLRAAQVRRLRTPELTPYCSAARVSWQRAWVHHGYLQSHCHCTSSGVSSCRKCSLWSVCADPQTAPLDLRSAPLLPASALSIQAPRPGQVVLTLAETLSWIRQRARQQPALRLQVLHLFLLALQSNMEL